LPVPRGPANRQDSCNEAVITVNTRGKIMLEIFGRRNSSNVIPVMWMVGELGLEHVRHNIGGSFGGDDTDDYKKLNPNKLIPTISDNGFVLWESNAITRYLCRQYGAGSLWPENLQQAALADQWMDWFKSQLSPNLMEVFRNLVRTPKDKQDTAKIKQCTQAAIGYLWVLEQHLGNQPFILGDSLSMGDIPTGAIMYKYFNLDIDRPSMPNIEAWYAQLCQRSAYKTHAMIAFGSSPEEWLELEKAGA
jgi:glutathione S-transferase